MNKEGRGSLPITDATMTRFNISLQGGVDMVMHAIEQAWGAVASFLKSLHKVRM
jgi:FlaA1/EpsC-like NDP-sugar epimerase